MQWVPPVLFGAGCVCLKALGVKTEEKDEKKKDKKTKKEDKKEAKQQKVAKPGWNLLAEIAEKERKAKQREESTEEDEEEEEEDEECEEEEESEESEEELKMVMVVRKDLKMQTGKMCAQCCHGCVGVLENVLSGKNDNWMKWYRSWSAGGNAKVALRANSEEELLQVRSNARAAGLPTYLVKDAGRTQIASGSKTVIAVGPAPISLINEVTGSFKLL
eukprot:TRINITY_DN19189_c0_g2_i1.p1 TRINITY_DN19189_c0_g2~~TRINITY_DN19189_c0_g2_i1.p1  ORF type:complete len:233 (+),score=82.93 TRINITY_DN19189_c0_g2_i1:47-700(+)